MRDFFADHKRLLLILGILVLLITIPLTIFIVQQRQNLQQQASVSKPGGNTDACGLIQVDVAENPSCPQIADVSNGQIVPKNASAKNDTSSYTTTYTLKNIDTQKHTVSYERQSYYCASAYGIAGKDNVSGVEYPYCVDNPQIETVNVDIESGAALPVIIQRASPTNTACGTFQTDFIIKSVDGNSSCLYQGPHPGNQDTNPVGATGFCQTGTACLLPTATPTPTATPSATPTPTRIVTLTPTPTMIASPSATPTPTTFIIATATPSSTPSATPTGTLTPTPTGSSTPTPTLVMSTLTPTSTPTPTTLLAQTTPTPTLPVTGNPLVTTLVGLGGMILVVLGGVAFFIL